MNFYHSILNHLQEFGFINIPMGALILSQREKDGGSDVVDIVYDDERLLMKIDGVCVPCLSTQHPPTDLHNTHT